MYLSRICHVQLPSLRPLAAASLSALLTFASVSAQAMVATGSMTVPRMMHQANALPDGLVLLSGGYVKPGTAPYNSAEIYDPATGLFTPIAPMLTARTQHGAVTLKDGRVLVMGGSIVTSPSLVGTNTAEIYDPATGQWTATGNLNQARWRVAARLLPDGKVFVTNTDGYSGPYAEIYDPATGLFTRTGNMLIASSWSGLVVLADGRLMKVGGQASGDYSTRAEIWNPATNQWSLTGSMAETRTNIRPALLPDGKVLVAGGNNIMVLQTTEIWDPATGLFTPGSALPEAMDVDTSTTLANGNVILTGPYSKSLLHYQAGAGVWNVTGPKRGKARETSVTPLANGGLLLAGGSALNDATAYGALWNPLCAMQKLALASIAQSVGGDGGASSWTLTGAPGCPFEVADLPAWLAPTASVPSAVPQAGSVAIGLAATANVTGAQRTATFLVGNNTATLTQATSPTCPAMPTLGPIYTQRYYPMAGTLAVSAATTCPWSITSLPAWVTPTSPMSGTGNGTVNYTTIANNGPARSGNGQISALGTASSFTMTQEAVSPCVGGIQLTNNTGTFPAAGGTGTISVASAATCPWTVSGLPAWASLTSSASGTGPGSFSFAVAANGDVARSGGGVVNGNGAASTFNLSQAASPCSTWSISPALSNFAAAGASGSFAVSAASTCSWSLGALPAWMSASSATSGAGNASISFTVAVNTGTARSATTTMSGSGPARTLTLNQATGVVISCASTPLTSGMAVSAMLQTSACTSGARGAAYYTDRYTFNGVPGQMVTILLTAPSFDTYLYLRNPAGTVIKSDDDGGGGLNSRIPAGSGSFVLPAGTSGVYTIEVTSYGSYKTGTYNLSFTQ